MKNRKITNIFKSIRVFNQIYRFLLIFFLINFFSINLQAHELWLEAKNFSFNNQDTLGVDIKIGQGFKGTPFGYYEPLKKKLYLENKNKKIILNQRNGNFPAIQILVLDKGFHILNYETNSEKLKYKSVEKFIEFLNEQNLISFKNSIEKNKIPTESYKRFAKILLSDGSNDFFIQEPNLDFEFIALNSPYDQNNNFFEFQLYKKAKPFGNWDVTVFSKDDENVFKEIVKTNPNGIGKLRLFDNRIYLLSAVDLRKANYMDKIKYKSDWLSFWASLVFER
jgi:hypothetical protein